jgi:hypothetical protein
LLLASGLASQTEEFARLDTQSVCNLAEDCNARRNVCPLNGSDVAATDPRPFGEPLLRQLTFMPQAAQICGQDILEIHARHKRYMRTIDPGTIVPIRSLICYSAQLRLSARPPSATSPDKPTAAEGQKHRLGSNVVLNGWHRLGIVLATAWALVVIGLAVLEYHVGRYEIGDGFFTCWEPYGSSPSAPAGKHSCGILARLEVTPGAFGSILPGTRYLNTWRFSAILLGPIVILGFGVLAVSWIVHGVRRGSRQQPLQHAQRPRLPSLPEQPIPSPLSHAEAWLDRLPRRWARNAAIGGSLLAAPSTLALLSKGDGVYIALLLAAFSLVMFPVAAWGYLCGLWARYSLKAPFALSPASAVNRIIPNWLTGAIILAGLLLASDVMFGWRSTTPLFRQGISHGDMGYLVGFFGIWLIGGYVTALVSRRGLIKAIAADRKSAPALSRPQTSGPERVPSSAQISIP